MVPTGIGRYTREILERMIRRSDHQFFLYGPSEVDLTGRPARIRACTLRFSVAASIEAQLRFPSWARHDELDLFWSPRHHLPPVHVPCVVTIHDMVWRALPESMPIHRRVAEQLLMPRALRRAARILAVSQSTRSDIVAFSHETASKVRVVPAAAFTSTAHAAAGAPDQRIILFVGTFEPRKNLARLLRAYRSLIGKLSELPPLVLAGRPGWKTDVPSMVRRLGLDRQVRLEIAPDDRALIALYQAADFLVMPSLHEGFGLPLLEAMALGKPVVTSNLSSMPEVAGGGGLLVDPRDEYAIANGMRRLLTDRGLHAKLSASARAHAAGFSWDRAADEVLRVFAELAPPADHARRVP